MSPRRAPAAIVGDCHLAGRLGQFFLSGHARLRCRQRGADEHDVREALSSCTSALWQEEHGRWRLDGGLDLDGDELTLAVTFDPGVIVVTVF